MLAVQFRLVRILGKVTGNLEIPTVELPAQLPEGNEILGPVGAWKSVSVELPMGIIGDTQTRAKCTGYDLPKGRCSTASIVGSVNIGATILGDGFDYSGEEEIDTPLYNLVPEEGYPAESASIFRVIASIYANVVRSNGGYGLRVAHPGLPGGRVGAFGAVITFYGNPAEVEKEPSKGAFLTNPLAARTNPKRHVPKWNRGKSGHPVASEEPQFSPNSRVANLLSPHFTPGVSMAPSEPGEGSQQGAPPRADEPSAYSFSLKSPQAEGFEELATPELQDVTVTLPEGVAISPSAADGLQLRGRGSGGHRHPQGRQRRRRTAARQRS